MLDANDVMSLKFSARFLTLFSTSFLVSFEEQKVKLELVEGY